MRILSALALTATVFLCLDAAAAEPLLVEPFGIRFTPPPGWRLLQSRPAGWEGPGTRVGGIGGTVQFMVAYAPELKGTPSRIHAQVQTRLGWSESPKPESRSVGKRPLWASRTAASGASAFLLTLTGSKGTRLLYFMAPGSFTPEDELGIERLLGSVEWTD
ncbi:MAG: hypothetical protein HY319_04545 [Armatimonadetes bacterium]|nr:hypothetical protein [Armatimonadota bacterium]